MNLLEVADKIGKDIAASQMFGCKNESQGRVIALSCLTTGRDILSVPEEYHLMNGKLSLQARAMLGRLVKAGGQYEILEHSPESCAIRVQYNGRTFEERLSWDEAQQEPFVYRGSDKEVIPKLLDPARRQELELSANYATPRRRMQHLWARVVSDAVGVAAPNLVSGTYTPEEVADWSGLVTPEPRTVEALGVSPVVSAVKELAVVQQVQQAASQQFANGAMARAVVEQPSAMVSSAQVSQHSQPATKSHALPEHVAEINQLLDRLEITGEKRAAGFAKRDVKSAEELTIEQAVEMLVGLREKAAKLVGHQQVETGSTSINVNGPISQELEARIKDKIKQIAQEDKDGPELAEKIRNKIKSSGIKLAQMRYGDAEQVLRELENKQLEVFFGRILKPAEQASEPGEQAGEST